MFNLIQASEATKREIAAQYGIPLEPTLREASSEGDAQKAAVPFVAGVCLCVRVCVCMCVYVCACVHAYVRAYMCVCVCDYLTAMPAGVCSDVQIHVLVI